MIKSLASDSCDTLLSHCLEIYSLSKMEPSNQPQSYIRLGALKRAMRDLEDFMETLPIEQDRELGKEFWSREVIKLSERI